MPKRLLRQHLDSAAKCRRKSMLIDDPSHLSTNLDIEDEQSENKQTTYGTKNKMKYIKTNKNNEIERLLLHNSKALAYHVDHCNFPAFNVGLWPQENKITFTNYPSCAFSVPRPIYVANKQCETLDLCYKRPMNMEFYKKRIRHSKTTYQTAWKNNKTLRSSAKKGIYHSAVFDIAERIYVQSDPFFHSSYDNYFTGGNLCTLPSNGSVVHAGGENLQSMLVSEFPVIENCMDSSSLANIVSQKSPENCEIFEFRPLMTSPDCSRQNYFITRQRNLISFNYLNDSKQIKTVTQFRTKSTPFISFAQSQRDIDTFIITTMKQHVRLYDLNCSVPALVKLFEISPKSPNISWNTVKPWREHTFLYANEKQFFLIDTRTSPEQWLEEVRTATDSSLCDHISAVLPSDFNNLFYVATNHKLHCMDIRLLKEFSFSDNEGAVCRWSHQLRYAPLMMDTFRIRQTEYVALSSPIAGDLHICQLSRERNEGELSLEHKHIYCSPCLPYQPPTLFEAYENARLSGKCLNPEANLEARLKCCTTGMTFMKLSVNDADSRIGVLLTSNSNGDIFAHTLSKRENKETEERCNNQSDEIMAAFEKKICEQIQSPLNYTEIKNMKSLRKVFLCKTLSLTKQYDFDKMENEYNEDEIPENNAGSPSNSAPKRRSKRLHLGRWQKPLSTLHSYKDALVSDLLSIWDIDVEEGNHIRLGNLLLNVKPDPTVKVEGWLKTNISIPPIATISDQDLVRSSDHEASHMFNNALNVTQPENATHDFENAIHSTQIMDTNDTNVSNNLDTSGFEIQIQNDSTTTVLRKLKSKKKSKKYVKGF